MKYLLMSALLFGCGKSSPLYKAGDCLKWVIEVEFQEPYVIYEIVEKVGKENYLMGDVKWSSYKGTRYEWSMYYEVKSFIFIEHYYIKVDKSLCEVE